VRVPEKKRRGPRYTPLSKRQDRPNAILWLLRYHDELRDAQIIRLVDTTKATIEQIRNRTHWNIANLTPMDPVTLGLCSQIDLDFEVARAAKNAPPKFENDEMLMPASLTENMALGSEESQELDAAKIFANFTSSRSEEKEKEAGDDTP